MQNGPEKPLSGIKGQLEKDLPDFKERFTKQQFLITSVITWRNMEILVSPLNEVSTDACKNDKYGNDHESNIFFVDNKDVIMVERVRSSFRNATEKY